MKKSLMSIVSFIGIIIFIFFLVACDKKVTTLDSLKNEYGIYVEGGSFEEGSLLNSNEVIQTSEEAITILEKIKDQNYNKDGNIYIFDIYVTKDGKKVQPNGKVKVSIPVPTVNVEKYLVFHIKSDNSVENIIPIISDGKITFETSSFSYFIIAEEIKEHVHDYQLIEGSEPSCTQEGIVKHYHCEECGKNFDMNYGEITDLTIEKLEHDFTEWYPSNELEDQHERSCKCGLSETGNCE